jgi:UDP-2,3-diacylglucosamine pyrophosphatase LpxH
MSPTSSGCGYQENRGQRRIETIGKSSKHRTLFLSDFHLGSRQCQAKRLYDFLWRNDAEHIYLIGDIIETSALFHRRWPPFHDDVMKLLYEKVLGGTRITFVPGNHDKLFRYHLGDYGSLRIADHARHTSATGKMFLIIHGDETDLLRIDVLLWAITKVEALTKISLWEALRKYIGPVIDHHTIAYENKIMALAMERGFLGVVCGHIHRPNIVDRGALYLNPGDWTWHCTAIGEDDQGNFEMLYG